MILAKNLAMIVVTKIKYLLFSIRYTISDLLAALPGRGGYDDSETIMRDSDGANSAAKLGVGLLVRYLDASSSGRFRALKIRSAGTPRPLFSPIPVHLSAR